MEISESQEWIATRLEVVFAPRVTAEQKKYPAVEEIQVETLRICE